MKKQELIKNENQETFASNEFETNETLNQTNESNKIEDGYEIFDETDLKKYANHINTNEDSRQEDV